MNFFPPQPPFMLSIPDMRVAAAAFQAVHDAQARAREANPRPPGVMRIITPDALINAAANDDVITARIFLEHGANVNVFDFYKEQWRPLHHAAYYGSHRVLQLLLNSPAVDVNALTTKRWRPIDACGTGEAARILLDAGAVQAAEVPGFSLSALHHAAFNGRPDVVEVLLARGAKVSETFSPDVTRNLFQGLSFGGTALHLAAVGVEIARSLKHSVVEPMGTSFDVLQPALASAQNAAERRVAVCAALLRAGADVDALTTAVPAAQGEAFGTSNCPLTPLALAAQAGDAAIVKELLRRGAKVDIVLCEDNGSTALHMAAHRGWTDVIRALVAGGARVDGCGAASYEKPTPLMLAIEENKHSAMRALLELGASSETATRLLSTQRLPDMDDTTLGILARHRSGRLTPARACSLPNCEARRRADYDDKTLLKCPCKLAYYCCKEHQLCDRKRHKDACKAALAAQEPL